MNYFRICLVFLGISKTEAVNYTGKEYSAFIYLFIYLFILHYENIHTCIQYAATFKGCKLIFLDEKKMGYFS